VVVRYWAGASAATLVGVRRTEQRRVATWALYQSDLLGRPLEQTFPHDVPAFTRAVAHLGRDHQAELDELIRTHAIGWSLERIAPLERSILRVGLAEVLYGSELPGDRPIPPEGAIDEAVETAKRFCGAEAPAFVNGILGAVLRESARSARVGPQSWVHPDR
jgi:transcription antitermination protein NusB